MKARIKPDLLEVIDAYFKGTEGHRTDPKFLALCDRIAGKVVTLVFTGGDAFEALDDNYWLPECCWEKVEPLRHTFGSDQPIMSLPSETKEDAAQWLTEFQRWSEQQSPYGTVLPANWKPSSVSLGHVYEKAAEIRERLGLNYWQMPYEKAIMIFEYRTLPRSTWEREVAKHKVTPHQTEN